MRTLVVAAHPDDEVLGCGGTIARRSEEGEEIHVLILGEGATSRAESRSKANASEVERLREASREAAQILGVVDVHHRGLPDNRFDQVPLLEIVKMIEEAISNVEADTLLVQHGGDVNIDHQRTFQASLAATRPQPGHPIRSLHAFEVASSTEWAFQKLAPPFQPSVFVDISSYLERKLNAMRAYGDELRDAPHPRSLERLEIQARRTGTIVGVDAAEAFQVIREIR